VLAVLASHGLVATASRHRAVAPVIISVDTVVDEDLDDADYSRRDAIIAANTNANYAPSSPSACYRPARASRESRAAMIAWGAMLVDGR